MSRIGKLPVKIPPKVELTIGENNQVTVKGPKGTLTDTLHPAMILERENDVILVKRPSEQKFHKSLHGLTRTLLNNMVVGVTEGYKKELDVNGVGYRVQKQGNALVMNLGYSHQVTVEELPDTTIEAPTPNKIIVSGCNKQVVGHLAAIIREKRPPEPYKGKGIRYVNEYVRRKEGKAGAKKK